jgi:hypothetical protein
MPGRSFVFCRLDLFSPYQKLAPPCRLPIRIDNHQVHAGLPVPSVHTFKKWIQNLIINPLRCIFMSPNHPAFYNQKQAQ